MYVFALLTATVRQSVLSDNQRHQIEGRKHLHRRRRYQWIVLHSDFCSCSLLTSFAADTLSVPVFC